MRRITIDTNLLVLLVVGLTSKGLIGKHKRTRAFSVDDYERLAGIVTSTGMVVLTAHTLAETSNLLRQVDSPAREMILSVSKQ